MPGHAADAHGWVHAVLLGGLALVAGAAIGTARADAAVGGLPPIGALADAAAPAGPAVAPAGWSTVTVTPLDEVEAVICPPLETVAGPDVSGLVCPAEALEHRFYTRMTAADGSEIAREHATTLGVPTPLDVDEDAGPDLIGTVALNGSDSVDLTVERWPDEAAALPVAVEAVLSDPGGGSLGRERFAFGYDARGDRAPGRFLLSTSIESVLRPAPSFLLSLAQEDPGERVAVLASTFDGSPAERVDPAEVRVDYGRSPGTATIAATVGDGGSEVDLTTGSSGPATIATRRVAGGDEQRVAADLGELPGTFGLDAAQGDRLARLTTTSPAPLARLDGRLERGGPQDGQGADFGLEGVPGDADVTLDLADGRLAYAGSAPIDRILASVEATRPVLLDATDFEADLRGVPQTLDVELDAGGGRVLVDPDNPVGQIDLRARSADRSFPEVPAGQAGALVDSSGGSTALALRAFDLRRFDVSVSPMTLDAQMRSGGRLVVDATLGGRSLDGVIDALPASARLSVADNVADGQANGSRLDLESSAPIGSVHFATAGREIVPGADRLEAALDSVPQRLSVTLPETGPLARVESRNVAGVHVATGQVRLAVSNGSASLPASVSDAMYLGNPGNSAFRDRIEFERGSANPAAVLRLTGLKAADVGADALAVTLDQDGTRTRPVAIDATVPNAVAGRPATVVTGLLDKPSHRTVLGLTVAEGEPTRLNVEGSAAVGRLVLAATDLGTVPQADLSLSNVPTRLNVCLDASSACRSTSRLPSALADYAGFEGNPSQDSAAGGENRPYPALVSMSFDDEGTSGTSSAIGSMVTLNATIQLRAGDPPIELTNVRFHNLALDFGEHPTSPSFPHMGISWPRVYMYLDSRALPFVANRISHPPTVRSLKLGTDSQPATGNRRLAWLPGTKCSSSVFGACVARDLDHRQNGAASCGGQREMIVSRAGADYNLFDHFGRPVVNVC